MMRLTDSVKDQVRTEWQSAPFGSKSGVIARWAAFLKCSHQTIYRALQIGRKRLGERKIKGIDTAARTVARVKKRFPKSIASRINTRQAIQIAIIFGLIPKEMESVSPCTFNRIIRENRRRKGRTGKK